MKFTYVSTKKEQPISHLWITYLKVCGFFTVSIWKSMPVLEKYVPCDSVLTNANTHQYFIETNAWYVRKGWGKAFSPQGNLTLVPCCPYAQHPSAPWSSVQHPSHQGPELTCLARPQTGRPLHQGVSKQTLQGHAARSIPRPSPSSENTSVSWFSSYPCCFFQVAPGACATGASVLHQGHHKWLCSAQPSGS